jgi:tRNA (mo5U34)-methyltransferase
MVVKRVSRGGISFTVSFSDQIAQRIKENILYRFLVRPLIRFMFAVDSPQDNIHEKKSMRLSVKNRKLKLSYEKPSGNSSYAMVPERTSEQENILRKISDVKWYHSINLGDGIVTPGSFDHGQYLSHYHLPEDLSGKRVLDVATFDGFWAFEFEKLGADEVIALDIESCDDLDVPLQARPKIPKEFFELEIGKGFKIAREILNSKIKRQVLSVYDLSPEYVGKFDMVFSSDLLIHLMNPMRALKNIQSVVSGLAIIAEPYNPELDDLSPDKKLVEFLGGWSGCVWWMFSLESLGNMILDAGFKEVELVDTFQLGPRGRDEKLWHAVFKATI